MRGLDASHVIHEVGSHVDIGVVLAGRRIATISSNALLAGQIAALLLILMLSLSEGSSNHGDPRGSCSILARRLDPVVIPMVTTLLYPVVGRVGGGYFLRLRGIIPVHAVLRGGGFREKPVDGDGAVSGNEASDVLRGHHTAYTPEACEQGEGGEGSRRIRSLVAEGNGYNDSPACSQESSRGDGGHRSTEAARK